jgi:hypothetical protein
VNKGDDAVECSSIKMSEQCVNDGHFKCQWVDSDGRCEGIRCSDLLSPEMCARGGGGGSECIWVSEEEDVNCWKVETSCEALSTKNLCFHLGAAGSLKCIWVVEEEEGHKCQSLKSSCVDINREKTCENLQSASLETEEVVLTLDCFWLYNGEEIGSSDGTCREKNDSTLSCSDAKRSDQCNKSDVDKFESNCLWLLENAVSQVGSRCENWVC